MSGAGAGFFPVGLEVSGTSGDPICEVEGIGLEALGSSPSAEIRCSNSVLGEKNAVGGNVLTWKGVHDTLLSEKSGS